MKLISLFNHKGGVSKTTTAFNLGWKLAEQGHKTLIVDTDPQCNLTAMVLGYKSIDDFGKFYDVHPYCDVFSCIEPVIDGSTGRITPAKPINAGIRNLDLLCGHLSLSDAETQMSVAITAREALPAIKNIPGCLGALFNEVARENGYEYILIDMSPSIGPLNECLLMSSDLFIVPTSPDFFCAQAITSLAKVIPKWNDTIKSFRAGGLYPFPKEPPKFLGFVSQRYRPRSGVPAKSFQEWIDKIKEEVSTRLIPALAPIGMTIDPAKFKACISTDEPFNLANISDFNSLIAQSQKCSKPVFALDDSEIQQVGITLENMKTSRDGFNKCFDKFAKELDALVKSI